MWLVKLTVRSPLSGRVGETEVRVPGDDADDLLFNQDFKWKHLDAMLNRGTLLRVDIDFRPSSTNGWD